MELYKAKHLAIQLMNEHGLLNSYWSFEFDNATKEYLYSFDSNEIKKFLNGIVSQIYKKAIR